MPPPTHLEYASKISVVVRKSYGAGYYGGYARCRWVRQYDAYGFYIGRERVCVY